MKSTHELSEEEKIRIARREYYRRWRKKHPEAQKKYTRRYWLKKYGQVKGE